MKSKMQKKIKKAANAMRQLRKHLAGSVLEDDASCFRASLDNLRLSSLPRAVIAIKDPADVGVVLKIASKYGVPVTSRGAGSSATGSAVPIQGGWVLDLSALDQIEIDPVARIAMVGAGAVTANLQEQAEALGLFYPPDPSSKSYSTLGGNIACNAGGMRCVKYGVTRDYVLGLKGCLLYTSPSPRD